uniref:protein-serine/threonine phosphatase n=1 Tax=Arcella intermedia TaxID=1963864 RepID=A0A6B2KYB7_9EUKA
MVICQLNTCEHPAHFNQMCVRCNKLVPTMHISSMIPGSSANVTVSHQEAEQREKNKKQRLLDERKLYLILDLDMTIIHAKKSYYNNLNPKDYNNEVFTFEVDNLQYAIKFRPGTKEFLNEVSKIYEIHIFTMGTRQYALRVVECMKQLTGNPGLFQDRILSRGENLRESKDLRLLFPQGGELAVIVDDREDMWRESSDNLVAIFPYKFWKEEGDINDPRLLFQIPGNSKTLDILSTDKESKSPSPSPTPPESTDGTNVSVSPGETEIVSQDQGPPANEITSNELGNEVPEMPTEIDKQFQMFEPLFDSNPYQEEKTEIENELKLEEEPQRTGRKRPRSEEEIQEPLDPKEMEIRDKLFSLPSIKKKTENNNNNKENEERAKERALHKQRIKEKEMERAKLARENLTKSITEEVRQHEEAEKQQELKIQLQKENEENEKRELISQISADTDNHLGSVIKVLQKTHHLFFSYYDEEKEISDVKVILNLLKRKCLSNCHLLFSGIIENSIDPRTHHIWKQAERFGAVCHTERDPEVTHIVARRAGTQKINDAIRDKANVFLVRGEWLQQSIFHWKKMNELQYPVLDYTVPDAPTPCPVLIGKKPPISSSESESDGEMQHDVNPLEEIDENELKEIEKELDLEEKSEEDGEESGGGGDEPTERAPAPAVVKPEIKVEEPPLPEPKKVSEPPKTGPNTILLLRPKEDASTKLDDFDVELSDAMDSIIPEEENPEEDPTEESSEYSNYDDSGDS